jgi:hypothetical protein
MLQYNEFDHGAGYRVEDLWRQYGPEIVARWVRKRPGTRPRCWWRFSSGLQRCRREKFPHVLLPIEGCIPSDQRQWLGERGYLVKGE